MSKQPSSPRPKAPVIKPPQISPKRELPKNPYGGKTVPNPARRSVFPFDNKTN